MGWFVIGDAGRTGPFADETIVQLLREGRLGRGSRVSQDGASEILLEDSPFGALPPAEAAGGRASAGAPSAPENSKRQGSKIGWLVVLALLGGGIYWLGRGETSSVDAEAAARAEKDEMTGAWVIAQQFVEQELKAPGTANFGGKDVQPAGAGRYRVSGWVDAQNGFGAKVRSRFAVTVEKVGDKTWKPVDRPTLSAW